MKRSYCCIFIVIFLSIFTFLSAPILSQEENSLDLRRVQKYDTQGNYITGWGVNGIGAGQFLHIHGIALYHSEFHITVVFVCQCP
jgi:hypothetical protein